MSTLTNTYRRNQNVSSQLHDIAQWHHDRNLIDGATDQAQMVKLMEEVGELAKNIARGKCIKDDVGDIVVVLMNLLERRGLSMQECLAQAWTDIKDRKGRMIDGMFVKEADL